MKPQGTQLSLFETRSSSDPFAVRVSPRARRLTARVHVGGRVEIVVPVGRQCRMRCAISCSASRPGSTARSPPCSASRSRRRSRARDASSSPSPASVSRWIGAADAQRRHRAVRRTGSWCTPPDRARRARAAAGLAQAGRLASGWRRGCCSLAGDLNYSVDARVDPLPAHPLGQLLDARHGEPELLAGVPETWTWCAICSSTSWRTPST